MATKAVVIGKGSVAKAIKLLQGMGAKISATPSKQGYNAYCVAMAIAPGTQAQINANAQLVANVQGLGITIQGNSIHPTLNLGHQYARTYFSGLSAKVAKPNVLGILWATLTPRCVTHNTVSASNCVPACVYGLYVVGQSKFTHTLLASVGKGSHKPTTKPNTQPTTTQPTNGAAGANTPPITPASTPTPQTS